MAASNRPKIMPPQPGGLEERRRLSEWMRQANVGQLSPPGTVTLTANATSTRVDNARAGTDSFIGLEPKTASAATERRQGTLFISAQGKGYFVISHQNNGVTDRTFSYTIMG